MTSTSTPTGRGCIGGGDGEGNSRRGVKEVEDIPTGTTSVTMANAVAAAGVALGPISSSSSPLHAFDGCELAFRQAHFASPMYNVPTGCLGGSTPTTRMVRVKTDAPVPSLTSTRGEVLPSAGTFIFPTQGTYQDSYAQNSPFFGRFIVWRANGPNLYLEEFSTTHDLQDSSFCINFSQSIIVPGTSIFLTCSTQPAPQQQQTPASSHSRQSATQQQQPSKTFTLVVVVPTQSGVNRFSIPLHAGGTNASFLSFPHTEAELERHHDCHHFSSGYVAAKASIAMVGVVDGQQHVVAAVRTEDGQLVRVTMASPLRGKSGGTEEVALEGSGRLLGRFFRSQFSPVCDATCIADETVDEEELDESHGRGTTAPKRRGRSKQRSSTTAEGVATIFSVHQDGKMRIWKSNVGSAIATMPLTEVLQDEPALLNNNIQISEVGVKAFRFAEQRRKTVAVVLKLQSPSISRFYILESSTCSSSTSTIEAKLQKLYSSKLETKHVVDFTCTPPSTITHNFTLWAVAKKDYSVEESEARSRGTNGSLYRPYHLLRCPVYLSGGGGGAVAAPGGLTSPAWESSEFGLGDDSYSGSPIQPTTASSPLAELKVKIFDGDHFPADVVQRSVELVCKSMGVSTNGFLLLEGFGSGFWSGDGGGGRSRATKDMEAMAKAVDTHLEAQLIEEEDKLSSSEEEAKQKRRETIAIFWQELYTACSALQEAESEPLSLLHLPTFGLIGVIQKSRFTVYLPPDELMRSTLIQPHRGTLRALFELLAVGCANNHAAEEETEGLTAEKTLGAVGAEQLTDFSKVVGLLARHSPNTVPEELLEGLGPGCVYLRSSFSTAFLAMALRRRVMGRLRFADAISRLLTLMPQICAVTNEIRMGSRAEIVNNSHCHHVAQIVACYSILWHALSERVLRYGTSPDNIIPSSSTTSGHHATTTGISIAQALFLFGGLKYLRKVPHYLAQPSMMQSNAAVGEDEEMEEEEICDDAATPTTLSRSNSSSLVQLPASRWDRSFSGSSLRMGKSLAGGSSCTSRVIDFEQQQQMQVDGGGGSTTAAELLLGGGEKDDYNDVRFRLFAEQVVEGMLGKMWPTSDSMTLPMFLMDNGYYHCLETYCESNEFTSIASSNSNGNSGDGSDANGEGGGTAYALSLFKAVAVAGMGKPAEAWNLLSSQIVAGVSAKDEVLNRVLTTIHPLPEEIMLPNGTVREHSLLEYFYKMMKVFASQGHSDYVVKAAEKAIQCAKQDDPMLSEIYTSLFTHHLTVCNNPVEALCSLLANPKPSHQSTCLRQLVAHLLDSGRNKLLVDLNYGVMTERVAEMLESRCRGEEAGGRGQMHDITYAFHVTRYNFDKAASAMYHLAQCLKGRIQTGELLQWRCRVLATVYQTMAILPTNFNDEEQQEYIPMWGTSSEADTTPASSTTRRGRNGFSIGHDEADGSGVEPMDAMESGGWELVGDGDQLFISREEIGRELLKAEARLELHNADPSKVPPLKNEDILREAIRHKLYDMSWVLINEFGMTPYELLEHVSTDAIVADKQSAMCGPNQGIPEWVSSNKQFISDRPDFEQKLKLHWRVVASYVDLALQKSHADTRALRSVGQTLCKFSVPIPDWLEARYKRVNFGDLLLLLTEYGDMREALEMLIPELDLAISKAATGDTQQLLPTTQIDLLLLHAKDDAEKGGTEEWAVRLNLLIGKATQKMQRLLGMHRSARRFDQLAATEPPEIMGNSRSKAGHSSKTTISSAAATGGGRQSRRY